MSNGTVRAKAFRSSTSFAATFASLVSTFILKPSVSASAASFNIPPTAATAPRPENASLSGVSALLTKFIIALAVRFTAASIVFNGLRSARTGAVMRRNAAAIHCPAVPSIRKAMLAARDARPMPKSTVATALTFGGSMPRMACVSLICNWKALKYVHSVNTPPARLRIGAITIPTARANTITALPSTLTGINKIPIARAMTRSGASSTLAPSATTPKPHARDSSVRRTAIAATTTECIPCDANAAPLATEVAPLVASTIPVPATVTAAET